MITASFNLITCRQSSKADSKFTPGRVGHREPFLHRCAFRESLLSLLRMHGHHGPERAQRRAGVPPASAGWKPALHDRRDACPTFRFTESLLSLLRMPRDHEPTLNPSQEGKGQDADECLFPSWEGSGVGRFMERGRYPKLRGLLNRLSPLRTEVRALGSMLRFAQLQGLESSGIAKAVLLVRMGHR